MLSQAIPETLRVFWLKSANMGRSIALQLWHQRVSIAVPEASGVLWLKGAHRGRSVALHLWHQRVSVLSKRAAACSGT